MRATGGFPVADRLRFQAAPDERQGLRGGPIEPLQVIHHAEQRLLSGHLRQQAQYGQTDQEALRCRPGTEAERGPQDVTLRNRQLIEVIHHRRAPSALSRVLGRENVSPSARHPPAAARPR